jgi:putative transposase
MIFHVLNRGVGRRNLFDQAEDFAAFERVLKETLRVRSMRVCAYCWMSSHWHFVLWPEHDGDLAAFMQQLMGAEAGLRQCEFRDRSSLRGC